MAQNTFSVQVTGIDELRLRLNSKRLLGPVRKELIEGAARVAQRTAQRAAKPHAADKGTLGRHLHIERDGPLTLAMRPTRRIVGIANVIEGGRRPGKAPPLRAIKAWAVAHGIPTAPRELQKTIRARGTRGVHFMQQAQDAADKAVKAGIPITEREIEAAFNRG